MDIPFVEIELDSKVVLLAVLVVIVLLSAGAYYFFGISVQDKVDEIIPISGKIQNVEEAYVEATASAVQRNEAVYTEGASKEFNNASMTVIEIGLDSAKIKVGDETSIIGSGKEHDFGSMVVAVKAITFSNAANARKVIISLNRSSSAFQETPGENQSLEMTLGEGQSSAYGTLNVEVVSISDSEVSVKVGDETKSIKNGETQVFGTMKIKLNDIFYTRQSEESGAVLVVTGLGR